MVYEHCHWQTLQNRSLFENKNICCTQVNNLSSISKEWAELISTQRFISLPTGTGEQPCADSGDFAASSPPRIAKHHIARDQSEFHCLCSAWFPLHSLFICLHFNIFMISQHVSLHHYSLSNIIGPRLRLCFWRINLLNHSTFSKPVILHLNASEHVPHSDWCEVFVHYQVDSCPPIPPTPGLLLSFIIKATEAELTISHLLPSPLPSHILSYLSPHSGSKQKTERSRRITPHYFGGPEIPLKCYLTIGASKVLGPKSLCVSQDFP